jgi:GNAT superfamily N-acetyltransferase
MIPMSPDDLELLAIQAEGTFDHRGRVTGLHGIVIARSAGHQALWIGAEVPDALAAKLTAAFDRARPASSAAEPPPALERCGQLLAREARSLRHSGGPSFVIEPDTVFASQVHIERSDASNRAALQGANPGNWLPIEWDELLDGRLGPWTIATVRGQVVSLCHTPGPMTQRGAECGVWTHPGHRGRGYAAAVTAAWASVVRPTGRHLFYSTNAENLSSQCVARRLNLRPLGWTWRLGRARDDGDRAHPLSSLWRRL